jgi:hypothetical protein
MKNLSNISTKILIPGGGWFPLLVFTTHQIFSHVLHLYNCYPPTDIPVHFLGGLSIAFFVSRCFQLLPRQPVSRSRVVVLELILIGSLTASAAVCWEFAEFTKDRLLGTNVQVSLENTMIDLAMGVLGAMLFMLIRARQLRVGTSELREITFDWVRGNFAYHHPPTSR